MGSKTFSLRDNQQKRLSEFLGVYEVICALNGGGGRNLDNFCKLYIAPFYLCTFHQKIPKKNCTLQKKLRFNIFDS
jgi:hypothetical protein